MESAALHSSPRLPTIGFSQSGVQRPQSQALDGCFKAASFACGRSRLSSGSLRVPSAATFGHPHGTSHSQPCKPFCQAQTGLPQTWMHQGGGRSVSRNGHLLLTSAETAREFSGGNAAPRMCLRSGGSLLSKRRLAFQVKAGGGNGPTDEDITQELETFYQNLDLEYESVWDTKPAWCQPWTILLTGTVGITGSWQVLHVPVLTGVVTVLVGLWWFVFLLAYPQSYKDMIAQRREYQERLAAENGRPLGRE